MKNIPSFHFAVVVLLLFASIVQGQPASHANRSLETLALDCKHFGLASANDPPSAKGVPYTRGRDIEVRKGYLIQVFFVNDDTGNFVGILEKGPEILETARITRICLNKHIHPSKTNREGEIEFLSHLGKPLNIRFHLNKKSNDAGYLAQSSWRSPASDSLAVSDSFASGETPTKPAYGHYPKCLPPKMVKGGGEDLSFDFGQCLTAGQDDAIYTYDLYLNRQNSDGTVTGYDIDPQIINHGH